MPNPKSQNLRTIYQIKTNKMENRGGSSIRDDFRQEEQRKNYKAALKDEFASEAQEISSQLPSFAQYTNTSKILCKFCKNESLNYQMFQIHLKSTQHLKTVKLVKETYQSEDRKSLASKEL
jgi:thymidine kinase